VRERPLRILQVSTADLAGGAERSAWNLFETYRARGYGSWLAVGYKQGDDPDVMRIPRNARQGAWSRFYRLLRGHLAGYEQETRGVWRMGAWLDTLANWADTGPTLRRVVERRLGIEDFNYPGTRRLLALPPHRPDIVHCHNLHGGYFDLRSLSWLSHEVPVILNLRDAWLLSGHCAHSFDCERWVTGCGRCPDLNIYPAITRDATAYNWRRKQKIYARSSFYVTTPSEWLMRKVERSILAPAVVEARVVPNSVDLSVFHPEDRPTVRRQLGIPHDARVLLFTANGIRQNPWKDYETIRAAIAVVAERLHGQPVLFIALGEGAPSEPIGQAEVRFVPYQRDPIVVARYNQAADVYIHAARAEAWGRTITEALACGTPVVATAVGGIPEQVKGLESEDHGRNIADPNRYGVNQATGILVPAGDARGMAFGIERLLKDDTLRAVIGANAAKDARERFGLQRQADAFLRWYEQILRRGTPSRPWKNPTLTAGAR